MATSVNFGSLAGFTLVHERGLNSANQLKERVMKIIRREFLFLSGTTVLVPAMSKFALVQAQTGPKLTQILRNDLEGEAGQMKLTEVIKAGGFTQVRRATETPLNMILEARY